MPVGGEFFARFQIDEIASDLRRAEIDGQTQSGAGPARQSRRSRDRAHRRSDANRSGGPTPTVQCTTGRFRRQLTQAVGRFQPVDHALQIGAQIVQGGGGHFDFSRRGRLIDLQLARLPVELQTLIGDERGFGDVDLYIAVRLTAAGEALTGDSSSCEMKRRSASTGGVTLPDMITTRQRPHVPSPPHTDARPMPACRAASSRFVPGATSTRLPIGSKSISKVVLSWQCEQGV